MRRAFTILMLAMLSACATIPANAPAFSPAAEAPPGTANVYIYRTGAYPLLRGITVHVDHRELATFAEGAYTVVPLQAGSHEMRVSWPIDVLVPPLRFPIEIRGDSPRYVKITSRVGGFTPGSVVVEAISPPQPIAEAEMRACCRLISVRSAD